MSPYRTEKHPRFLVHQEKPFNGGPPLDLLREAFVTPVNLFFTRNHGDIPPVDAGSYRLEVDGNIPEPLSLSFNELRNQFPTVHLPATLQCAGNRRQELMKIEPVPGELGWGPEAAGHAEWTGVRLADVLAAAGLNKDISAEQHVEFSGLDRVERPGMADFHFGGSIPLQKALQPEVILAFAMNGEALTPLHGFPLRVVAPGYIGARSVKWLSRIVVRNEPSHNYFQRQAYRLFPAHVRAATVKWDEGRMLGETYINSAICSPQEGAQIQAGNVAIRGYATGSGQRQVQRVEISTDHGATWVQARLSADGGAWAWRFWQADVNLKPGKHTLIVRAVDADGNSQPPDLTQVWNFKGYMNHAWQRVNVEAAP